MKAATFSIELGVLEILGMLVRELMNTNACGIKEEVTLETGKDMQ